jgi:hypothetical protein
VQVTDLCEYLDMDSDEYRQGVRDAMDAALQGFDATSEHFHKVPVECGGTATSALLMAQRQVVRRTFELLTSSWSDSSRRAQMGERRSETRRAGEPPWLETVGPFESDHR